MTIRYHQVLSLTFTTVRPHFLLSDTPTILAISPHLEIRMARSWKGHCEAIESASASEPDMKSEPRCCDFYLHLKKITSFIKDLHSVAPDLLKSGHNRPLKFVLESCFKDTGSTIKQSYPTCVITNLAQGASLGDLALLIEIKVHPLCVFRGADCRMQAGAVGCGLLISFKAFEDLC